MYFVGPDLVFTWNKTKICQEYYSLSIQFKNQYKLKQIDTIVLFLSSQNINIIVKNTLFSKF